MILTDDYDIIDIHEGNLPVHPDIMMIKIIGSSTVHFAIKTSSVCSGKLPYMMRRLAPY